MKAIVLHEYGGVENLRYEDVPMPKAGYGEVLVKISAASVNPVDWKIRSGAMKDIMPIALPYIMGGDAAGVVVAVGEGIKKLEPGQFVMGMVQHGYAEYLVAKESDLTIVPDGLDVEAAGALGMVLTTGAQLAERMRPQSGQTVLITGALGSVGRTAVYLSKQAGALTIAGVRGKQAEEARKIGADQVVALDDEKEIYDLAQLDAIGDTVNGDTISKLIPKIKPQGILVSLLGPPRGLSRTDIHVEAISASPDANRLNQLARMVARKELSIPIVNRFKLSEAATAQSMAEQGKASGKVILLP